MRPVEVDPFRCSADSRRRLRKVGQRSELRDPVDGDNVTVGDDIRIGHRGLRGLVGVRRHASMTHELVHPLVESGRFDRLEHPVAQKFLFRRPVAGRSTVRCLDARDREKVLMQVRQKIAQLNPAAVLGAHAVIVKTRHHRHRIGRRLRRRQDAAFAQLRRLYAAHVLGQQAPHQRGIKGEAAPGCPTSMQARKHRRRDALRCGMRRHLHRRIAGTPSTRNAFQAHHPTELRRHDRLDGRIVAVRTVFAETRYDAVYEVSPMFRQTGVIEAERLPAFPIQRRHDRIRSVDDERTQPVHRLRIFEIHLQHRLAAQPRLRRGHRAERVPARRLHLDDLGTKVGKGPWLRDPSPGRGPGPRSQCPAVVRSPVSPTPQVPRGWYRTAESVRLRGTRAAGR